MHIQRERNHHSSITKYCSGTDLYQLYRNDIPILEEEVMRIFADEKTIPSVGEGRDKATECNE